MRQQTELIKNDRSGERFSAKLSSWVARQTGIERARLDYTITVYQASHIIFSSMTELHQLLSTWMEVKVACKHTEAG